MADPSHITSGLVGVAVCNLTGRDRMILILLLVILRLIDLIYCSYMLRNVEPASLATRG